MISGEFHTYQATAGLLLIVAAIFGIDKQMSFPGWWALLPTVGTLLLISAGPNAWPNRNVLSHRALVFIGLISYPLYLWHWPLLSFANIVESGTPTETIRIAAILVSFLLAWATYQFIEKPIRLRKRYATPVLLLVVMTLIAGIGYGTYREDGIESRVSRIEAATEKLRDMPRSMHGCEKHFLFPAYYCYASSGAINRNNSNNTILFIGDSHSMALSYGFLGVLENKKWPHEMLAIGKIGCLPFIGVERFTENGWANCQDNVVPVLDLTKEQSVEHVVILARYSTYITGRGYGPDDVAGKFHIQAPGPRLPSSQADYPAIFSKGLRDTLEILTKRGKRIIFVHQIPELNFAPKSCSVRPFSLLGAHACRMQRALVDERQKPYREAVKSILGDFPDIKVFDPMSYLCDKTYCYAVINDKMMYRDRQHISNAGAEYLSNELIGYLTH